MSTSTEASISYTGYFKLLLIRLLKDSSQLLLLNLQILVDWFLSSSYPYSPTEQKHYSEVLFIHIHVSPSKSKGKLADETRAVSILSVVFCITCLSNSKQKM